MRPNNPVSLNERQRKLLRAAMLDAGLNRAQLADKVKLTRQSVSKILNGTRSPSVAALERIGRALHVPIKATTTVLVGTRRNIYTLRGTDG